MAKFVNKFLNNNQRTNFGVGNIDVSNQINGAQKEMGQAIKNYKESSKISNNANNDSSTQPIKQRPVMTIQNMPEDLLDEFKILIETPAKNNRTKWLEFLDKYHEAGGTVSFLSELYRIFTL